MFARCEFALCITSPIPAWKYMSNGFLMVTKHFFHDFHPRKHAHLKNEVCIGKHNNVRKKHFFAILARPFMIQHGLKFFFRRLNCPWCIFWYDSKHVLVTQFANVMQKNGRKVVFCNFRLIIKDKSGLKKKFTRLTWTLRIFWFFKNSIWSTFIFLHKFAFVTVPPPNHPRKSRNFKFHIQHFDPQACVRA